MGDHDTTEFDITECAVTNFHEFGITESEITVKGNCYNEIRYKGRSNKYVRTGYTAHADGRATQDYPLRAYVLNASSLTLK